MADQLSAVVTEEFFERPARLRTCHPELYDQMAQFYRQDPEKQFAERGL